MSPSTRREWIEISHTARTRRELQSPSTRREWIEIIMLFFVDLLRLVSLHTEGVD